MFHPQILLAVAIGGSCGALVRYLAAAAVATRGGAPIWTTLGVNLLGSLLIGVAAAAAANGNLSPLAKAAVVSGFLGSLTTFSTYSLETMALMREDRFGMAAAYALGSIAVGLLAAGLGWQLTHRS
jgi:CrcB protein